MITFKKRDIAKLLKLHKHFVSKFQKPKGDVIRFECRKGGKLVVTTGLSEQVRIVTTNPEGIEYRGYEFCWDVPLSGLHKAAQSLKASETATLTPSESEEVIECRLPKVTIMLPTVEADIPDQPLPVGVLGSLPARTLHDAIVRVKHCAAKKDVRLFLEGVWLQFNSDAVSAVLAIDGHRISAVTFGGKVDDYEHTLMIPPTAVAGTLAALAEAGSERVQIVGSKAEHDFDHFKAVALLFEGGRMVSFPGLDADPARVAHIFPEGECEFGVLEADSSELAEALASVKSLVGGALDKSVRIVCADGGVELHGRISLAGHSTAETPKDTGITVKVKANTYGGFDPIAFNLAYVLEAAQSAVRAGGGLIQIQMQGENLAAQIVRLDAESCGRCRELVMPLRH